VGGREEAAGPGPEGLRALLWCCQHSGTRKRERAAEREEEKWVAGRTNQLDACARGCS